MMDGLRYRTWARSCLTLDLEGDVVQSTPDASRRLGGTLHDSSFQRLYLRSRRIEQQLNFFLYPCDFESIEWDNFFSVVN
jgi:hypothetical protein